MSFSKLLFNRAAKLTKYNTLTTKRFASGEPIRVLVAGAAGQIGYSILPLLARGNCFDPKEKVILHLYDVEATKNIMEGIRMELEDCAFPAFVEAKVFTNPVDAFKNIDYAIMLANRMVLGADMKRAELLEANRDLFTDMGRMFQQQAKPTAKVLMVANPCNTNALIMMKNAPKMPKTSFSSMSRLDHNRVVSTVARKLQVGNDQVIKACVWGNHSSSMYPDIRHCEYRHEYSPLAVNESAFKVLSDNDYHKKEFMPFIQERAFEVIRARNKSSALSAANAAVDHIRDWHLGTPQGTWSTMGVYVEKEVYGIPKGIFFAMPCVCHDKQYYIIDDLPMDKFSKEIIEKSVTELLEERKMAGL